MTVDGNAPEIDAASKPGLERLCAEHEDERILHARGRDALERIDVTMARFTYAEHRHDSYALGVTMAGAQGFRYRGESRVSLPGNYLVLHPDEAHDGKACDERGLRYRMLYLDPAQLYEALPEGVTSLPFLAEPVGRDPAFLALLRSGLATFEDGVDQLEADGFLAEIAQHMARLSGLGSGREGPLPVPQLKAVAEHLTERACHAVSSADLERLSGLDRFQLARAFRRMHGTSPHRFLIMRRLAEARRRIGSGEALAAVAAETGFADQAHLTRAFKKAYGMTPGRWAHMVGAA